MTDSKNLENILNEKSTGINGILDNAKTDKEKTNKRYDSKVNTVNKNRRKELKELDKQRTLDVATLEESYKPQIVNALTQDLQSDYNCLLDACDYIPVSDDLINEAIEAKQFLVGKHKETVEQFKKFMRPELKELVEKEDPKEMRNPKEINTYVSYNGDRAYVVVPTIEGPQEGLAKELEEKINQVIDHGEITVGRGKKLKFEGEPIGYSNGFLVFGISSNESPKEIARYLKEKLNHPNIQPSGFEDKNLVHKSIPLEYGVFKGFRGDAQEEAGVVAIKVASPKKPFKIPKKYNDINKVIDDYNTINAAFKKENEGRDITKAELNGFKAEGISGSTLYASLREYIRNGALNKDNVEEGSSLEKYVKTKRAKI
jgi:hypothetical protein